tara:strand:- start:24396 stop:24683 length:288 start_codon:yes stop_codon:yes gene_type:complete
MTFKTSGADSVFSIGTAPFFGEVRIAIESIPKKKSDANSQDKALQKEETPAKKDDCYKKKIYGKEVFKMVLAKDAKHKKNQHVCGCKIKQFLHSL